MKPSSASVLRLVFVAVGLASVLATVRAQVVLPGTLILTEADNGTTADAVVGQAVSVTLRGNITTGYAWGLATVIGGSVVTNGPVTYAPASGGGVGVGGTFVFPFLAAKPDDTVLTFENRPPGGGTPAQTFSVTVHVLRPPPPSLSVKLVNLAVVLSWPIAGSTNFFLEGTGTLAPAHWAALNVLPLPEGTDNTVTLGTSGTALYFRLSD